MLNKENINPSTNAKLDEFLWETVSHNMLFLQNSKKVLLQATGSTSHDNRHSTVSNFLDICYLVELLANELAFKEQLGQSDAKNKLPALFINGTSSLARSILLVDYIDSSQGNQGTIYTGDRDKNKQNNANAADDNADTVER